MSIRNLTAQLDQERTDFHRAQQFKTVRSGEVPDHRQEPTKQTPFMTGGGYRNSVVQDHAPESSIQQQTTPPSVGIKERDQQTTYGIPGGIAARFGRYALKEPHTPPVPTTESLPDTVDELQEERASENQSPQHQERVNEQEEATRITIELQSH
jgi:hypothetical protein